MVPGRFVLFDAFTARNRADGFAALRDGGTACWRDERCIVPRRDHVQLAIEITR